MQMLLLSLAAASMTVILHDIGMENNLYKTYWWFDIITHIFGGFTLGALISTLFSEKIRNNMLILSTVLIPIIGWEIFEIFFVSVGISSIGYIKETIADILTGMLGAYYAIIVVYKKV